MVEEGKENQNLKFIEGLEEKHRVGVAKPVVLVFAGQPEDVVFQLINPPHSRDQEAKGEE